LSGPTDLPLSKVGPFAMLEMGEPHGKINLA